MISSLAACRKRSKPLLKFPLIKAGASVFCQRPFRHQTEVLNDTKHQTKLGYNISEILSSMMLFNGEITADTVSRRQQFSDLVRRAGTVKHSKTHAFAKACCKNGQHISPMRQIVYGWVSCSCFAVNNISIDSFTVKSPWWVIRTNSQRSIAVKLTFFFIFPFRV